MLKIQTGSIILSFLLGSAAVVAQKSVEYFKGYVVTSVGDTLKGEIRVNNKSQIEAFDKVTYQNGPTDKRSFRANKAKSYSVNGDFYVSKKVEDKFVFLKQLSGGAVTLYEHKTEQFVMNDIRVYTDYYMQKGDGELIQIKESKYRKQLAEIMSDNPALIKDIQNKKYNFDKLVDIFEKYNNPKDNEDKEG